MFVFRKLAKLEWILLPLHPLDVWSPHMHSWRAGARRALHQENGRDCFSSWHVCQLLRQVPHMQAASQSSGTLTFLISRTILVPQKNKISAGNSADPEWNIVFPILLLIQCEEAVCQNASASADRLNDSSLSFRSIVRWSVIDEFLILLMMND